MSGFNSNQQRMRMMYQQNPGQQQVCSLFCQNLKFTYSEKATKLGKISTVDLSYVVPVKCTAEISQNFVASSEYQPAEYTYEL